MLRHRRVAVEVSPSPSPSSSQVLKIVVRFVLASSGSCTACNCLEVPAGQPENKQQQKKNDGSNYKKHKNKKQKKKNNEPTSKVKAVAHCYPGTFWYPSLPSRFAASPFYEQNTTLPLNIFTLSYLTNYIHSTSCPTSSKLSWSSSNDVANRLDWVYYGCMNKIYYIFIVLLYFSTNKPDYI